MFKATLLIIATAAFASVAVADHVITLVNNCPGSIPVWVDSAPGNVAYTGPQPGTIGQGATTSVTVPNGWNSRICNNNDGKNCADGASTQSLAEFNMDSGGLDYYDISNIPGFTVGQEIQAHNTSPYGGCGTVECTSPSCACDQAYPPGNEAGCGSQVDAPVRSCPSSGDFTITYCP